MMARAIFRWIMPSTYRSSALVPTARLGILFSVQQAQIGSDNLMAYLQAPDTPIFQPAP